MHHGAGNGGEPEPIGHALSGEGPRHGAQQRIDSAGRELFDAFVYVIDARGSGHRVRNFGDGTTLVVRRISVGDISARYLARSEAALEFLDDGAMADPGSEMQDAVVPWINVPSKSTATTAHFCDVPMYVPSLSARRTRIARSGTVMASRLAAVMRSQSLRTMAERPTAEASRETQHSGSMPEWYSTRRRVQLAEIRLGDHAHLVGIRERCARRRVR